MENPKIYFKYLWYVIKHKWYVMLECFKQGLWWRGLTHDLSKLRWSEFVPYAKHFYGKKAHLYTQRDSTGYYKPTNTGDPDFDFAWLLHQKRNDHHWQWWCCPEEGNSIKVFPMSKKAMTEMVCDWIGAGRAQGFKGDKYEEVRRWYSKNRDRMILEETTRFLIESKIKWNAWCMSRCSKCETYKHTFLDFDKDKRAKRGCSSWCKECKKESKKEKKLAKEFEDTIKKYMITNSHSQFLNTWAWEDKNNKKYF